MAETKDNPTVSVIIPTYNRSQLVGRAIQSVLNQTYQDFDLIVVDDASTDNTEEVVKNFNDERIRYIRLEKNSGTSAVPRNTAIKVARCEYIAFQDSDDEWLPEKLEKQMTLFEIQPPEVGVVYTGFWKTSNRRKVYIPSSEITQKEGNIHRELLKRNFIGTPTSIVKRECFKKVGGFDEELPQLMDWELWIRISKYYQFKCIDEPLVISYYTPGGVNEQGYLILAKTHKLILKKHFESFKQDRGALANHYLGVGDLLCSSGEFIQGRNYLIKAAQAYPLNIKILGAALVSLLGQNIYFRAFSSYMKIKNWFCKEQF
jgi:glycosyltransferase involved in cell wall biosynthesis